MSDALWGGFVRSESGTASNTVIAGRPQQDKLSLEVVGDSINLAPQQSPVIVVDNTKTSSSCTPAVSEKEVAVAVILSDSMSKEDRIRYLMHCRDYLTTQIALIDAQLDKEQQG